MFESGIANIIPSVPSAEKFNFRYLSDTDSFAKACTKVKLRS